MVDYSSFWFPYSIIVLVAFVGFITPFILRENILFGSRFPNEIINHPEVENLKRNYKHLYLSIYIPFLLALGLFLYYSPENNYFLGGVIVEAVLLYLIYAVYNKKAKELKKELLSQENYNTKKEVLTVDTKFREGKYIISIWWFLPSLIIILLNIFILFHNYNKIPDQIILHFNLEGVATGLTNKSYLHVLIIPLTSMLILVAFLVMYFFIKMSKQELDSNKPVTSKLRDRYFRLIWSDYAVILCTMLVAWMFFVSLHIDKLLVISGNAFEIFNIAIPFLIISSTLILTLKTGQSGSKLRIKANELATGMNNVDDDSSWKFGMIYYNPHDPSIFVQKRMGIGWTVNMGRPAGIVILIALIVIPIIWGIISK
ncbi:MAG: DUF1648 domain-containing protein [Candidatus Thorarchaeota archaeon]